MGLAASTAAAATAWLDGLALRMDHGSQYLSDHFTNQIKFWCASSRPNAFAGSVRLPQTATAVPSKVQSHKEQMPVGTGSSAPLLAHAKERPEPRPLCQPH